MKTLTMTILLLIFINIFAIAQEMAIYTPDSTIVYSIADIDSICFNIVTDVDGNIYKTVKIGDQWWMAENLRVTQYRDGTAITHETDQGAWGSLSSGAYCAYNNDDNNVSTYGLLYNWYAVNDNHNIAPEGWHVPTDDEWKDLEMYLGMSQAEADAVNWRGTTEGGKLKETDTVHWNSPNTGATNFSGFTALPSGYRTSNGSFLTLSYNGFWWSSIPNSSEMAWNRELKYDNAQVLRNSNPKRAGYSIRCIKD